MRYVAREGELGNPWRASPEGIPNFIECGREILAKRLIANFYLSDSAHKLLN